MDILSIEKFLAGPSELDKKVVALDKMIDMLKRKVTLFEELREATIWEQCEYLLTFIPMNTRWQKAYVDSSGNWVLYKKPVPLTQKSIGYTDELRCHKVKSDMAKYIQRNGLDWSKIYITPEHKNLWQTT